MGHDPWGSDSLLIRSPRWAGRASQRGQFNGRAPQPRANCLESHTPVNANRTMLTSRSRTTKLLDTLGRQSMTGGW